MKLKLTVNEEHYYHNTFLVKVAILPKGFEFTASYLFDPLYTSARICRRFYEDVKAGLFPKIRLKGVRSREGYVVD